MIARSRAPRRYFAGIGQSIRGGGPRAKVRWARFRPAGAVAGAFCYAGQTAEAVLPTGKLVLQGGKPLHGKVRVSGSKNAADSALAACLLTGEECVLENVPDIEDVRLMASILSFLGADVRSEGGGRWRIRADKVYRYDAPNEVVTRQRASFQV